MNPDTYLAGRLGIASALLLSLSSCVSSAIYDPVPKPPPALRQHIVDRITMIVTLPPQQAAKLMRQSSLNSSQPVSVSTATPISPNGLLLTAAHCVKGMQPGDVTVVYYSPIKHNRRGQARILWKDERADLALIQVPFPTPSFYAWTPRDRLLPEGTRVIHGGLATGPKAQVGQLLESLAGTGHFMRPWVRHSLRLQPGDSGGPLLATSGELIGINRAVGYVGVMDTSFFTESQSTRPDPAKIQGIINAVR